MSLRGRAGALLCLLLVSACGDDPTTVTLARFERPNRVDFVCVLDGEPVQLEHCKSDIRGNDLALHALVTQAARGEIAALDLDVQLVIDSRRDIPGFTFLPVGEAPVAVVVPPRHPEVTYVANYGSRDIRALTTAALVTPQSADPALRILRLALDEDDRVHVLQPQDGVEDSAAELEGLRVIAPTDMVLAPQENALIVAAADVGLVIWLPIERCRDGAPDCVPGLFDEDAIAAVPLQRSIERALSSEPEPAAPSAYERLCEFSGGGATQPAAQPDIPDETWMKAPRPTALAIDDDCPEEGECTPRVLIADESLPIIHALDLAALSAGGDVEDAVLAPLTSGAPTIAVAVSPRVPATVDAGGETQYVYAIDASDGSVMVLENGQVLAVNTGESGRPERIAFQTNAGATAIAVVTPNFDVDEGAEQWVPANQCTDDVHTTRAEPARLRGVFLASAHTDGIVRFVDIHDMELKEPAGGVACRDCPNTDPPMPVLMRHQQRLESNFLAVGESEVTPPTAPISDPRFVADGVAFSVRTDGTTGNPQVPGLDCIACDPGLLRAYPPPDSTVGEGASAADADAGAEADDFEGCASDTPALVCGNPDPWSGAGEQWAATYEGVIPGTIGGRGRLIPQGSEESMTGALELAAEIDFCSAGVLGEEDIAPSYEGQSCESGADNRGHGDQLVLRSTLQHPDGLADASDAVVARCRSVQQALEDEDSGPIGFEIRRAYRNRLVLRSTLPQSIGEVATFDELEPCLQSGLIAFDVRTSAQFTVIGSLSGFQHNVRANAAGRCVVDDDADLLEQGRARPGCTFSNGAIGFRLHRPQGVELDLESGIALFVAASAPAPKLAVNIASSGLGTVAVVARQLRFEPLSGVLYVVDEHGRGLIPITLDPVPDFVSGSFN